MGRARNPWPRVPDLPRAARQGLGVSPPGANGAPRVTATPVPRGTASPDVRWTRHPRRAVRAHGGPPPGRPARAVARERGVWSLRCWACGPVAVSRRCWACGSVCGGSVGRSVVCPAAVGLRARRTPPCGAEPRRSGPVPTVVCLRARLAGPAASPPCGVARVHREHRTVGRRRERPAARHHRGGQGRTYDRPPAARRGGLCPAMTACAQSTASSRPSLADSSTKERSPPRATTGRDTRAAPVSSRHRSRPGPSAPTSTAASDPPDPTT